MARCCARRRTDTPPLDDNDYEVLPEEENRWATLYHRWRRIARLKRIWAFLGHRLRELKNGG